MDRDNNSHKRQQTNASLGANKDTNNVLAKRKVYKGPVCLDKETDLAEIPSKIQKTQNNQTETTCLAMKMTETKSAKKIRVWMDGCYDLVHYGHADAFRKAKKMGHTLTVGVISDAEITRGKGYPPILTEEERSQMIRAIKWVDEVVDGVSYGTAVETLSEHNCDFCVHGDDVSFHSDGTHVYDRTGFVAGRNFRTFPRLKGPISTTNLITRILAAFAPEDNTVSSSTSSTAHQTEILTQYMNTSRWISDFTTGNGPSPSDTIVYIAGDFDLYHLGHIELLEKAGSYGDYLIVGIYSDQDIAMQEGKQFPILNLHERVMSVLSNRYVSEVVIGADYVITEAFLDQFNIDVIIRTPNSKGNSKCVGDPFKEITDKSMIKCLDYEMEFTKENIIERVLLNRTMFEERNQKRAEKDKSQKQIVEQLKLDSKLAK